MNNHEQSDSINETNDAIYEDAKALIDSKTIAGYSSAIEKLESIKGWKDTSALIAYCKESINQLEGNKAEPKASKKKIIKISIVALIFCGFIAGIIGVSHNKSQGPDQPEIDFVEPEKVVKSIQIGDAEFNLANDWYCEEGVNSEKSVSYYFYPNGKSNDGVSVGLTGSYFYNLANYDTSNDTNADNNLQKTYEYLAANFYTINGFEVTKQEIVTRNDMPAYHLMVHHDEAKADQDIFMFMANKNDIVITACYTNEKAENDYNNDYIEFVRGIKTEADGYVAKPREEPKKDAIENQKESKKEKYDKQEKEEKNNQNEVKEAVKDKLITDTGEKQIWEIYVKNGEFRMTADYSGSGNFIVKISDPNQSLEEVLCNEIGDFHLDKTVYLQSGLHYLEIYSTDGYWEGQWEGTFGN